MTEHEISILLLESSATDAKRIKDELGAENVHFKSKRVMSKKSYLKALDEFHPDVILTDYDLLHFDALSAIKDAKEKAPTTPIIVITNRDDTDRAVRCMKAGATDYILKNNIGQLVPVIQDALQNGKAAASCDDLEKYRLMIEEANEAIFIAQEGMLVFANPKTLDLLACTADDMRGKPFTIFIHPDDQETVIERYKKRLAGQNVPNVYSFRMVDMLGNTKWVEISSVCFTWNKKPATLNFLKDITERKQLESALNSLATSFAKLSGKKLYKAVSNHLAKTLNMDYAFIGELSEDINKVQVLGGFAQGKSMEPFEYNLQNSPCENVAGQTLKCYPENVQTLFPKSNLLAEWGIEGFIGTPLFASSGKPLGIAILLNKKPIKNQNLAKSMLAVFSERIAAEIERKHAGDALRESEDRYRRLFDTSPNPVIVHCEGKVVSANTAAAHFVGAKDPDELLGKNIIDCVHPDHRDIVRQRTIEIIKNQAPGKLIEEKFITLKNEIRNVEVAATPFLYKGKQAVQVAFRDITEREQAEAALKEKEALLSAVVETAKDSIFIKDETLKYIRVNPAMEELFQTNAKDLLGKTDIDLFGREAGEKVMAIDRRVLTGETVEEFPSK
ncbi:MAG: PAS domain S-box protein, partial [Calditrichaeota bacterium]|nr:PAS domain S-box protein [Calditrichota bacterium]